MYHRRALVLGLSFWLAGLAHAQQSLLLAAGAGYRKPVLELAQRFEQERGVRVEASFGNMRQVQTQAEQNPEVALLIGDEAFLQPMGLFERYVPLGEGRLVLVAARGVPLAGIQDLKDVRFRRVAVPNRAQAVYGRAAYTCLQREGLDGVLGERLMEVATVPQVGTYVATGEVDAGFVNATEALALKDRAGAAVTLPVACHDPIRISVGVVRGRGDAPAAQAFLDFVAGPSARAVLQRHGL